MYTPDPGTCIISCGMDNHLKAWALDSPDVTAAVKESYHFQHPAPRPFPTRHVQHPDFSSIYVHSDYVDSALWIGNLVLSK